MGATGDRLRGRSSHRETLSSSAPPGPEPEPQTVAAKNRGTEGRKLVSNRTAETDLAEHYGPGGQGQFWLQNISAQTEVFLSKSFRSWDRILLCSPDCLQAFDNPGSVF